MKNVAKSLLLAAAFLFIGAQLFASSVDYLSNRSATHVMMQSTNALTTSADAVAYNPAGTVFLPKGLSVDVSNQFLFSFYTNRIGVNMGNSGLDGYRTVDEMNQVLLLPNLYIVYNFGDLGFGKMAAFVDLGAVGGGGTLKWKSGTAGTNAFLMKMFLPTAVGGANITALGGVKSQKFEGSSAYYAGGLGVAYGLKNDLLSVSFEGRAVIPRKSFSLSAAYTSGDTLDAEFDFNASGFTPIVGLDIQPVKGLIIALRYEAETALKFKYKEKKAEISGTNVSALQAAVGQALTHAKIGDGVKFDYNLPHVIGIGVGYDISKAMNVSLSSNIYLLSLADMDGVEDNFGTGWEIGAGMSYMLLDNLKLSCGLMYSNMGTKPRYFRDQDAALNASANAPLDHVSFGVGETYTFGTGIDFTLALMYVHYLTEDYSYANGALYGKYTKDIFSVSVGLGYKM